MNLPQQLQEYLKYPALQVIDPNNGLPVNIDAFDSLSQAVLITFLEGLYKATRTKEDATVIEKEQYAEHLLSRIFTKDELLNTVVVYTKQPANVVKTKLLEVANGYISLMQLQPVEGEKPEGYLRDVMTSQRSEILKYVPGELKLGELLNDPTVDDNTHKMEGPISSLMHKIENAFSASD